MKVSIITVVFNNAATIEDSIRSVASQSYRNLEHIVIDGGSTDGTVEILNDYRESLANIVSEPDKGIYDAMNKGIRLTSGQIVGILNADDIYADKHVIDEVVGSFIEHNKESCYADLIYVDRFDTDKVIRYWRSGDFHKEKFRKGWMPPHPTFFVKRVVYERWGCFNLAFPLAADYEIMLRFLYKHDISTIYIPKVLVKMRTGGTSNPGIYTVKAILENYKAWTVNGLSPNPMTFFLKPFSKIFQFRKTQKV